MAFDSTGNDGGGNTAVDTSVNNGGNNVADTSNNEPTPIELDENALIRIKGQDKPVKFGEYGRNFQSQWTKAAQKAKALEAELAKERATRERYERERQAAGDRNNPNRNNSDAMLESLKTLPYLSGEQAAKVVSDIAGQIKQRDAILLGALKQMEKMQRIVQGLHQNHSTTSFESKIQRWLDEGGYPKEASNLAKEIYLAYEGDDLDQEFPRIFKERWDEIGRIVEAQRQAKLNAARKPAFVPGKGGQASPSRPLTFKGNESARDIAESLWKEYNGPET